MSEHSNPVVMKNAKRETVLEAEYGIEETAMIVFDARADIRRLQGVLKEATRDLMQQIIKKGAFDLLTINYGLLRKHLQRKGVVA